MLRYLALVRSITSWRRHEQSTNTDIQDGLIAAYRDTTLQHALDTLHACNYNIDKALVNITKQVWIRRRKGKDEVPQFSTVSLSRQPRPAPFATAACP